MRCDAMRCDAMRCNAMRVSWSESMYLLNFLGPLIVLLLVVVVVVLLLLPPPPLPLLLPPLVVLRRAAAQSWSSETAAPLRTAKMPRPTEYRITASIPGYFRVPP